MKFTESHVNDLSVDECSFDLFVDEVLTVAIYADAFPLYSRRLSRGTDTCV